MANPEHLKIIRQGAEDWNRWMERNLDTELQPDLSGAILNGIDLQGAFLRNVNLSQSTLREGKFYGSDFNGANLSHSDLQGADLSHADLSWANFEGTNLSSKETNMWKVVCNGTNFRGANLSRANLREAFISQKAELSGKGTNLSYADLSGSYLCGAVFTNANLMGAKLQNANLGDDFGSVDLVGVDLADADLYQANLTCADLTGANLFKAYLVEANLSRANLTDADLRQVHMERANLVEANLTRAKLDGSFVYGVSVWKATLLDTKQDNLTVTPEDEPVVTVDNLEVAQFIYLLLHREKLRNVLDTITSKAVLILGRFTPERKVVLDAIAGELRRHRLLPIVFDFERSIARDFTETIKILAGMSLFVIADISNPKSAPLELQATVPDYQIPFIPIIQEGEQPFSMLADLAGKYDWVVKPVLEYRSLDQLCGAFKTVVIDRAWAKHRELQKKKMEKIEVLSVDDYLKI